MDDSTRRLLRFSMFLQGFGLAMFAVALIVQFATGTTSAITIFFGVAIILLALALGFTARTLRRA